MTTSLPARFVFLAVALTLSCFPLCARACTVTLHYRIPHNIELVDEADLIVLARVERARAERPNWPGDAIQLRVVEGLKGSAAPTILSVEGSTKRMFTGEDAVFEPTPLSQPNASSGDGACARTAYLPGTLVVAMFRSGRDGFTPLAYPFARQIEDVRSDQDTWVRAVRLYLSAPARNAPARRRYFSELADRLATDGIAGDSEIAADIRGYLRGQHRHLFGEMPMPATTRSANP